MPGLTELPTTTFSSSIFWCCWVSIMGGWQEAHNTTTPAPRWWTYLGPDFGKWHPEPPPASIKNESLRKNCVPRSPMQLKVEGLGPFIDCINPVVGTKLGNLTVVCVVHGLVQTLAGKSGSSSWWRCNLRDLTLEPWLWYWPLDC